MAGRRVPVLAAVALIVAACAGAPAPSSPAPAATGGPTPSPGSFLVPGVVEAPPIELTASDGQPFSLASLRGEAVLLSFGYTHCPDVCPATVGLVGQVITALAPDVKALFVTIDPARDTVPWLQEYVKYLARGYQALTGTVDQIRTTATAWGVQYARVDTGDPAGYSMTHTSDVFLVDRAGLLRARFPFGTGSGAMTAIVKQILDGPEPPGAPTP
ncbi:MAG TPA: SCO family protein, partial [Candidatus Limnocylindrales bacterium]|nr:SCO family protein [Candidatus Limnocylindrales bacterium]